MVCTDRPETTAAPRQPGMTAGADFLSEGDRPNLTPCPSGRQELRSSLRGLRIVCWSAALLLGAFDAWFRQFSMSATGSNPDAVAYIDLAAAYARGDWAHALNAYWSPLYSWLLALAFHLLHPTAFAEFPVIHLVNMMIFVGALGSFDYCLRAWMEDQHAQVIDSPTGWLSLPPGALLVISYALFAWSAISLIGVQGMSPDLLVAGLVYLAAGLTLRLRRGDAPPRTAALLGLVLGLGYLAKAVMLPLAGVFLLVALLPAREPRRTARALLGAGLSFLIVTAPFIYGLSRQQGHFTLGETGRLNYAWCVNNATQLDWQGETPGNGTPLHPTQLLYPRPPVYGFAGPIEGTYPLWTDPTYWDAGMTARFNWRQQVHTILRNLNDYREILWIDQSSLAAVMLLLLLTAARATQRRWPARVRGDLLVLSLAPMILYGLVVVQTRYLGAYVVLFWLALLPAIRLPVNETSRAVLIPATLAILLTPTVLLARTTTRNVLRRSAGHADWDAAIGLKALGVHPGDRMGSIGLSFDVSWARLARVSVVAHVPSQRQTEYWTASPSVRAAVLRAFSQAGVRAVVAEPPPAGTDTSGWRRLGVTDWYIRFLGPTAHPSIARLRTGEQAHG